MAYAATRKGAPGVCSGPREKYIPLDNSCSNDYIPAVARRRKTRNGSTPFADRLFVSLLRAADGLAQGAEAVMKTAGITGAQYNVLRILRGAQPGGLACRMIGDRMISHDPDMTRLLDRMESRGLISRERQKDDRRVVKTRITGQGLELLKTLDQPVHDLHRQQFRHMTMARLRLLEELLEEVQNRQPEEQRTRAGSRRV